MIFAIGMADVSAATQVLGAGLNAYDWTHMVEHACCRLRSANDLDVAAVQVLLRHARLMDGRPFPPQDAVIARGQPRRHGQVERKGGFWRQHDVISACTAWIVAKNYPVDRRVLALVV